MHFRVYLLSLCTYSLLYYIFNKKEKGYHDSQIVDIVLILLGQVGFIFKNFSDASSRNELFLFLLDISV